jgi:hypothetical protein
MAKTNGQGVNCGDGVHKGPTSKLKTTHGFLFFFLKLPSFIGDNKNKKKGVGGGALALGERVGTFHLRIKLTPPPNKKNCHKKEKNKTKRPSNECPGKWHIVVLNRIFHD